MEKSRYSEKIYELQDNIRVKYPTQIQMLEINTEKSRKDLETATTGNAILTIGDRTHDMTDPDGKKAGAEALKAALNDPKNSSEAVIHEVKIGEYRGFRLSMLFDNLTKAWKGCLEGNKPHYLDWNIHTDVGNITRMDNCIKHIEEEIKKSSDKHDTLKGELEQMKVDVEKPFAKETELRDAVAELDDVHMQLTQFTLTDDTAQKEMFERLVEMFTPILTGDIGYQKYTAEGDSMEPFIIEMEGDVLTLAHTYVKNGDLMWDPRIDFKIDYEDRKATPISYEMSCLGVYEEYDIENPTPQLMEKINEQIDFADGWLDNVEADEYKPIDKGEKVQTISHDIAI